MSPKVTVIIPCYNYARYLPEAVESLVRQSLADWEAIVIDDASTDESALVMQGLTDPRIIKVYHKENIGNIATYNEGIGLARGEFIVLLSSDDRYHPDFLRKTVRMFDSHQEVAVVYTGVEVIDAAGRVQYSLQHTLNRHRYDGVYDELPTLLMNNSIPNCASVVRRSVLDEVGSFDPRFPNAGDYDLWLRIALKYKMGFVKEPLYQYRLHGNNMSFTRGRGHLIEGELVQIIEQILNHPNLPTSGQRLQKRARANLYWSFGCWRLQRRDVRNGLERLLRAMTHDPWIVTSPIPVGKLMRAVVLGALNMPSRSV
jgi:glycosyltransferase involved in cell wall biosynthesis